MNVIKNQSLKSLNTFGFDQHAQQFVETRSTDELVQAIKYANEQALPIFMLGGGSNIVLTRDIAGLVIRQQTSNIHYEQTGNVYTVTCDAGVRWHDLVMDTLARDLYGLENLSLIPGDVGAAPIQNIGAYGVELCQVLETVSTVDLQTGEFRTFTNNECQFGYRDSIFKSRYAGRLAIDSIQLRLSSERKVVTHYDALAAELKRRNLPSPTSREISAVVCAIRSGKLPDPAKIGNAGSFFKNPVIADAHYKQLRQHYPELPGHQQATGDWKIPAAWLIDSLGWKGVCRKSVCVHQNQALVLIHKGGSTGSELLALADEIKNSVSSQFDVNLEQEPTTL